MRVRWSEGVLCNSQNIITNVCESVWKELRHEKAFILPSQLIRNKFYYLFSHFMCILKLFRSELPGWMESIMKSQWKTINHSRANVAGPLKVNGFSMFIRIYICEKLGTVLNSIKNVTRKSKKKKRKKISQRTFSFFSSISRKFFLCKSTRRTERKREVSHNKHNEEK